MLEYSESLLGRVIPPSERAYQQALVDAYNSAVLQLSTTKGEFTQKRLLGVISSISDELYTINDVYKEAIKTDLEVIVGANNAYHSAELSAGLSNVGIPSNLYAVPTETMKKLIDIKNINYYRVDSKGTTIKTVVSANTMINSIAKNQSSKVRAVILGEYAKGTAPSSIARKLSPYMTTQSKRDVRTVTNSLIGEASARAEQEFYKANQEFVGEYLYVATLDSRTSSICRSLDGQRFDKPVPQATPKLHPNCRSTLVAVPEGYVAGQRPIVLDDGTVEIINDNNFTYADAVKRYPDLDNKKFINLDTYLNKVKPPSYTPTVNIEAVSTVAEFNDHFKEIKDNDIINIINMMPTLGKNYGDTFKGNNFTLKTGARSSHYDGWARELQLKSEDLALSRVSLHEYGHFVDFTTSAATEKNTYMPSAQLLGAIDKDKALLSINTRTKAGKQKVLDIFNDINGVKDHEKSDILDAFAGGYVFDKRIGAGHGAKYYKGLFSSQSEIFANLFSLKARGVDIDDIRKYFPNTIEEFEKILSEVQSFETTY